MLFLKWHIIHLELVKETNQFSAGAVSEFFQVLRRSSASGQWGNTEAVKRHILFIYLSQWADHKVFSYKKAFLGNRVQLPAVLLRALWTHESQTALCTLWCQEQIFVTYLCVFMEQNKLQLVKQYKNGPNEMWWEQIYLTLVRQYSCLYMTLIIYTPVIITYIKWLWSQMVYFHFIL